MKRLELLKEQYEQLKARRDRELRWVVFDDSSVRKLESEMMTIAEEIDVIERYPWRFAGYEFPRSVPPPRPIHIPPPRNGAEAVVTVLALFVASLIAIAVDRMD